MKKTGPVYGSNQKVLMRVWEIENFPRGVWWGRKWCKVLFFKGLSGGAVVWFL
jgi:hypothetical protein